MTKINVKSGSSYTRALTICQNLAEHTAYHVGGDQTLLPTESRTGAYATREVILMPGVRLASQKMAEGIAILGSIALGVRALRSETGGYTADVTVLFLADGKAERYEGMRAWIDSEQGLYLIPNIDADEASKVCFKFDQGLRKTPPPWKDEADRSRGLAEAHALLVAEGTDQRSS